MKANWFSSPRLCLLVLSMVLAPVSHVRTGRAAVGLPADLATLVAAGASVNMLASAPFSASPEGQQQALTLSRVVPGTEDQPTLIVAGGPELWFADSGRTELTGEDGTTVSIEPGTQAILQDSGQYTVQFEGTACPSALRLELTAVFAMEISTDESAPSLGPDGVACPAGGTLFDASQTVSARPDPALGFIARVTWPGQAYVGPATFSGPIGYAVDSGRLRLAGLDGGDVELASGSWAVVTGGQPHTMAVNSTTPASALVAGAVISEIAPPTPVPTPTPAVGVQGNRYVSPGYGYSLSWDASWSVATEASAAGVDTLELTNGVSDVYFQAYGGFTGDAPACVASIGDSLPNQPGFSEIAPRTAADGKPVRGGDALRAFAAFDFTYTTDTGSSRYSEYIECRTLIPGDAMLVVTQIVLARDYASQIPRLGALLKNLTVPSYGAAESLLIA